MNLPTLFYTLFYTLSPLSPLFLFLLYLAVFVTADDETNESYAPRSSDDL